ncbi:Rpn family recombination-promoting nuclease/putative transposase [Salinispira pacifica]
MASFHDSFFKFVFSPPERARELLSLSLPPDVLQQLDLETLRPVKGSFIPSELRETYSDLLFEATFRSSLNRQTDLFVYFLFEHKSAADPSTLLQLLGYMIKIWEPYRIRNATHLPPIIPIIVYHGRQKWNAPRTFSEYFSPTLSLPGLNPEFRPLLLDVGRIPGGAVSDLSAITRSGLAALRYAFERRHGILRTALASEITDNPAGELLDYFRGLITYLLRISPPEEERVILKSVRTPTAREVVVTIAEKYISEGALAERRGVLIRLLEKKFGLTGDERILVEQTDDLNRLAAALDEILFADSKQQILDKLA